MKKIILFIFTINFLFAQQRQMPPIPVKVFTVNNEKVNITKSFSAITKAYSKVNITARVSGNLEKRYFKEGQRVKKGDLLYKIEATTYLAKVNEAKARLRQAQAALTKALKDWKRYKKLYASKSISAYTKDQYLYNYQNAQANVQNFKAVLKNAQIQYSYTTIKAPISGLISTTKINEGNFIQAGTILTSITKIDPVYAEFSLPQKDISKYLSAIKDKNVKLSINSDGKIYDNGKLEYISPILDSSTDSLLIKASFANTDSNIIIGQFVDIFLSGISMPNVISIPEEAILQNGTMSLVYLVKNNMAIPQPVKTAGLSVNGILVQGLKEGDKIIISNIAKVRPKSKVQILKDK